MQWEFEFHCPIKIKIRAQDTLKSIRDLVHSDCKLFYGLSCDSIPGGIGLPFCVELVKIPAKFIRPLIRVHGCVTKLFCLVTPNHVVSSHNNSIRGCLVSVMEVSSRDRSVSSRDRSRDLILWVSVLRFKGLGRARDFSIETTRPEEKKI